MRIKVIFIDDIDCKSRANAVVFNKRERVNKRDIENSRSPNEEYV